MPRLTTSASARDADAVGRRVRRRQALRRAAAGGAAVAALALAVMVATLGSAGPWSDRPAPLTTAEDPVDGAPTPDSGGASSRTGALPGDEAASCPEEYTPGAVAGRAFAFDGTVVAIERPTTYRHLETTQVTFKVHRWFSGGSGPEVTVTMSAPGDPGTRRDETDEAGPAYGPMTRLLVSGEPRWGGAPLEDAFAWGCGFTRYHDDVTAEAWAGATQTEASAVLRDLGVILADPARGGRG